MTRVMLCLWLWAGSFAQGAELDSFGWREDCRDPARWTRQPGWQGNPSPTAAAQRDGQTLCFRVNEPHRGMKWSLELPPLVLQESPWLAVRYRAENLNTVSDDYFLYANDGNHQRQLQALRLKDVVADGQWHVAAVDLSELTEAETLQALALQVPANASGKAAVWLEWLVLGQSAPPDATIIRRAPPIPAAADWQAPLADARWTAQPDWLGNPAAAGEVQVDCQKAATLFRVAVAGQGMKWSWTLPHPVVLAGHRFLSLRYRASGASPVSDYAVCVLGKSSGAGDLGYLPAVPAEGLQADGRWHTLEVDIRRVAAKYSTITGLAFQVQAAEPNAVVELSDLRLVNRRQPAALADALRWQAGAIWPGQVAVPLPSAGRSSAGAWRSQLNLSDWFQGPQVTVEGLPFALAEREPELAVTAIRASGEIRMRATGRASEVYLLLLAACIGQDEPVYGSGLLQTIRDVDRFRIRLEYADGAADECLPWNVVTRRFEVRSGPQVVVAAADATRELTAIVVQDRCQQAAFAVAGVTMRHSGPAAFPEAREEGPSPTTGRSSTRPDRGAALAGKLEALLALETAPLLRQLLQKPSGWTFLTEACPLFELRVAGQLIPLNRFERMEPDGKQAEAEAAKLTWYRVRELDGLLVGLAVRAASADSLRIEVVVRNAGQSERPVTLVAPRIGPYRLSAQADDAYYLFPRRGTVLDHRDGSFRERYSGLFPVQLLDTFSPADARGLTLRTEDTTCLRKVYCLDKKAGAFTLGVEYPEQLLKPGETLRAAPAVVTLTDGDGRRGLAAYRSWLNTWHRPAAPRRDWFREVFNFRQRFLWTLDPLYDSARGEVQLQRAVDEARREFGGVDFLHLFDWGNVTGVGRIYGRTGDLSPYDSLRGGRDGLQRAIADVQVQGIPVGLYIEGYLLEQRGQLGKQSGAAWQLLGRDGRKLFWPESTEMFICPAVEAWREVQASTYATKVRELGVNGMYIDEFGFTEPGKDCWSPAHGHPVPSYPVVTERDCTRLIRERLAGAKRDVAIYTEETPVDVTTQLQDGSFTYAMLSARQAQNRLPLNLSRFAFPDFKTIEILFCDKPTGSWATGVRWVFFNGEAIWLEGKADEWFQPQTRAEIRRCYALLRKHRDAFTTLDAEPLVPTELSGVFGNRFSTAQKSVYTLYNSRHRTVRGVVLRVPHRAEGAYYDEWLHRPAEVRCEGTDDLLSTELGPHGTGCIVVLEPDH